MTKGSPPVDSTTGSPAGCAIVTDGAIETLMQFVPQMPSSASGVGLQQMHGVASRVAPSATAFPHRAEQYDFLIGSQWSDATDSDRNIEWTRALFEAMQPHLEESVYVNNLGDEGPGRVQAAYGENYPRLAAVKRTYDPDNLFRANQNIDPSTDIIQESNDPRAERLGVLGRLPACIWSSAIARLGAARALRRRSASRWSHGNLPGRHRGLICPETCAGVACSRATTKTWGR